MNHFDELTLQAYVDGALDAPGSARVDAALAHDDALAARVHQARTLRAQVRAVFDPVLDEPVPARLSALLQPQRKATPGSIDRVGGGRRFGAGRRLASRRWLVPAMALAASLAIAVTTLWWKPDHAPVSVRDGQRFASGALSDALDHALASEPDPRAAVMVGLTFRQADGQICRTFVHHPKPAMAGLACHGDAGWALPVLTATEEHGGELRQAASGLPAGVQAAVDATLQGDAFDAAQERAARDAGWR